MKVTTARLAGLLLLAIWLLACTPPLPEEKQLALEIDRMQEAADGKQLASLMQHFHASFLGRNNMPKQELQAHIFLHFRINPRVRVYISQQTITITDDDAEVRCHLLVTGSQQTMPDRGRLYRVSSNWKKIDDKWLVVDADWEDVVEGWAR